VPAIVIPYRGDAKRRLPSSLRAAVAVAMLGDVVEAAAQVGRVLVVTDDASVVPADAEIVLDPGEGLGRAVAVGLATVREHALVVNADLPAATPDALRRLADAGLALVEAADGTTNALSLPDPGVYAALYGPGSAERLLQLPEAHVRGGGGRQVAFVMIHLPRRNKRLTIRAKRTHCDRLYGP